MIRNLGLDDQITYPLIKQIFRQYTLHTIQKAEWVTKDEEGRTVSGDSVITMETMQDSLDGCFLEVIEIEKIVHSKHLSEIIRVFDNYVVKIPCSCDKPTC